MYKSFYQIAVPAILEEVELIGFLKEIDNDFFPPLTSKVNLAEYARKLQASAEFCLARDKETHKVLGMVVCYCNDPKKDNAYVPVIGVHNSARGQGLGGALLNSMIAYLNEKQFKYLFLETCEGSAAQNLYESRGFEVINKVQDRPDNLCSVKMRKVLKNGE